MRSLSSFLTTISTLLTLLVSKKSPESLKKIKAQIKKIYPHISHISTETLAEWLTQPDKPLLLDIRESEEYEVSHLRDAHQVTPNTQIEQVEILKEKDKTDKIVVYCSVGVRSAQFAEKLQQAGYPNVYNLNGSIFAWANENRPLYQGQGQVTKVHPYNSFWGKLLVPNYRAKI